MQQASLDTHIKVQYLAIDGEQSAENGLSYFNTLGVRQCTVILAAGEVPVAALLAGSTQFPTITQVVIGPTATSSTTVALSSSVIVIDATSADTITSQTQEIVSTVA